MWGISHVEDLPQGRELSNSFNSVKCLSSYIVKKATFISESQNQQSRCRAGK